MKRYGVVDEFANKTTEVHAIFWGVYKGFQPQKGRYEYTDEPTHIQKEIDHEWHYYTFGYVLGRLGFLTLILIANELGLNLSNLGVI